MLQLVRSFSVSGGGIAHRPLRQLLPSGSTNDPRPRDPVNPQPCTDPAGEGQGVPKTRTSHSPGPGRPSSQLPIWACARNASFRALGVQSLGDPRWGRVANILSRQPAVPRVLILGAGWGKN